MIADILDVSVPAAVSFGIVMFGLGGLLIFCESKDRVEKEKKRLAALNADRENAARQEQQRLYDEAQQWQKEAEKASKAAVAQAVQQAKASVEERYRASLVAGDMEKLATQLKESHMRFSRRGKVLTVRVFAVITGWVGIEWILDPDQPSYITVIGKRDGITVFAENAYRGVFTDILVRGREYYFRFAAMFGHTDREESEFYVVVRIPTRGEWNRQVTEPPPPAVAPEPDPSQRVKEKIESMKAVDEFWDKYIKEELQRIDASEGSDMDKRRRKAALLARVQEERDKEEGRA